MSMRLGASVCQVLAVISVPRSARITREGSCWVKPGFVAAVLELEVPEFSEALVM